MIKLLLVDDELEILDGLTNSVDWHAHNIEIRGTARDGRQALDLLGTMSIDYIVTDIKMPRLSGLELAREAHRNYPSIRIIIVSGFADFGFAQEAISCGVSRYLLKPVDIDELIATVLNDWTDQESRGSDAEPLPFLPSFYPDDVSTSSISAHATRKALEFIEQFYFQNISVEQVASFVQKSPNYLSTKFRKDTGYSFTSLLNHIRIKASEHLLVQTEDTIDQIAIRSGFSDSGYFIKVFKQKHDLTPGEYRKSII